MLLYCLPGSSPTLTGRQTNTWWPSAWSAYTAHDDLIGRQIQQAGDRGDLVEIALQWALFDGAKGQHLADRAGMLGDCGASSSW